MSKITDAPAVTNNPHRHKVRDDRVIVYIDYKHETLKVIIDIADAARVLRHRWQFLNGYIKNKQLGYLHNFITDYSGKHDHVNTNKLDCRKSNLRRCTFQENNCNVGLRRNNKSGAKGVSWHSKLGKWKASIMSKGKSMHLGYFSCVVKAAKAYNKAAREHHGEFARLNGIKSLKMLHNLD